MTSLVSVFTSTRADYSGLRTVMRAIESDSNLMLEVIASGTHFSDKYGRSIDDLEKDSWSQIVRLDVGFGEDEDTSELSHATSRILAQVSDYFAESRPDLLVLLGDRFELLAPAAAAVIHRIPIAHIHGGEVTTGAIDEQIRHAISKLALLHFVSTDEYRTRLLQLGEDPRRVFLVGAPALDSVSEVAFLSRKELEESLGFSLHGPVGLITYHPVTTDLQESERGASAIATAVRELNVRAVITGSNADPGMQDSLAPILGLVESDPSNYCYRPHLGASLYFSCMKEFDMVLGNSSSGIIEAPSFRIPVVNVGSRQAGRVRAKNVIDAAAEKLDVSRSVREALSKNFRENLENLVNPYDKYGDGQCGERICSEIRSFLSRPFSLVKEFHDVTSEFLT